ncbi:hypothetical protein E2P71_05685 [Candidatus Bathyarchaeota archaeon]|nr:hypothetical protein E2P71_05685 [Candidatus Bathyarchaeota archaeon]
MTNMKTATVVQVIDGKSFRLRTDAILVIDGLNIPERGTEGAKKAQEKLEELVLKKKISYETTTWDALGRTNAKIYLDELDIKEAMEAFLRTL